MPAIPLRLIKAEDISCLSLISKAYPYTSGLIIALSNEKGECVRYWDGDMFMLFGSETRAEDPKTLSSKMIPFQLKKAKEYASQIIVDEKIVDLAFWLHPEFDYQAIDKYKNLRYLFPGCPRQ